MDYLTKEVYFHEWAEAAGLWPEEAKAARLMVSGLTNKEMAEALDLTYDGVLAANKRVFNRLGIQDRFKLFGLFLNYVLKTKLNDTAREVT